MGVNATVADDWAGHRGRRWLRDVDVMEEQLAPVGEALLQRAAPAPGERVLDVGCGAGWTTRRIAEAVGPDGLALGLDISEPLLAEAARRGAGLPQLRFQLGDAGQVQPEGGPFDRLMSRFGVMFFGDPPAAFRHLASLLKPEGQLNLAVWAEPARNPWMTEMRRIVGRHVELPTVDPLAPGPFQLAGPAFHGQLLEQAGFVGLERELLELPMWIGGRGATPATAAAFALGAFSVGELAEAAGPAVHQAVIAELEQLYAGLATSEGVAMPAAVWMLSARRG